MIRIARFGVRVKPLDISVCTITLVHLVGFPLDQKDELDQLHT